MLAVPAYSGQTQDVDLTRVDLSPNARWHSPESITELADDLKRNGLLQEIVVTAGASGRFEVISGNRRTLAARQLRWPAIRARVLQGLSDFDKLRIAFSENDEVEGVSAMHQAELIQSMMGLWKDSQAALARQLGKTPGYISQYLTVAALPAEVRQTFNRLNVLGLRHLLELCRLKKAQDQIDLATKCQQGNWPVSRLNHEVDLILGEKPKPPVHWSDPLADI